MNDRGAAVGDAAEFVVAPVMTAATTPAGAQLHYQPPPEWVRHNPAPNVPATALEDFTDQGVLRILNDCQVSLMERGSATCIRIVQRILTRAGAERAANLAIEFDPTNDRLEIHTIRVRRNGSTIDHAVPGAMQLLRRESQLERLALNGRFTASFVIPDLREGDELELCFTHVGFNPVLAGRYGGWLIFPGFAPWVETRIRIIRPSTRLLGLKAFNSPPQVLVSTNETVVEQTWSVVEQKRVAVEDLTPPWTIRNPCYQCSEFTAWAEVVPVFAPHYQDVDLPADLTHACDQIAAGGAEPARLAVEWLRFVQRELRYFAFSSGEGGLVPRDLETIWARRFGDCKDAARLYVAGARRLGLDAAAALVSTTHGPSLDQFLPSAHVFNHVIVRLRIAGKTYWLDPTSPWQSGALDQLVTQHAGWVLPLTADTHALESLPQATPLETVRCDDRITIGSKLTSAAQLVRRVDFAYWAADTVRHRIANDGAAKVAQQLTQELFVTWPQARETTPPVFEDDPAANHLTLHVSCELPTPWKLEEGGKRQMFPLSDTVINREIAQLKVTRRSAPIYLGRPRRVSWRATVNMPRHWSGRGWHHLIDETGFRLASNLEISDRTVLVERQLSINDWSVPAAEADSYVRAVTMANQNLVRLYARVQFGYIVSPTNLLLRLLANRWGRLLLIIIVIAIINSLNGHP
jgi:transglutaminase-like putative cysteine protease